MWPWSSQGRWAGALGNIEKYGEKQLLLHLILDFKDCIPEYCFFFLHEQQSYGPIYSCDSQVFGQHLARCVT